MSNPFKKIAANAETSKSENHNSGIRMKTSVVSKSCDSCGAPRPKNSNLVYCDYCKTPFMANMNQFKADS